MTFLVNIRYTKFSVINLSVSRKTLIFAVDFNSDRSMPTVKDIFEMRKQGRIEEAYEAIRPMYAVHKGHYTTLCMFWTASDILKKRVQEKRHDEALKIFEALLRMLPTVDDRDGRAHSSVLHDAVMLSRETDGFSMLDFLERYGVGQLRDADWQGTTATPADGKNGSSGGFAIHPIPSVAHQLLTQAFHEVQRQPTIDSALRAMPLLEEAMRRTPRNKNCQRYMAVSYTIVGERQKAVDIYRQLLTRYRDSYLYAELADLTDDPGQRTSLLCQAIMNQHQEQFRTGYRLALAKMLVGRDDARAQHELQKCVAARKAQGLGVTRELQSLLSQTASSQPATDAEQQDFYRRMAAKYPL